MLPSIGNIVNDWLIIVKTFIQLNGLIMNKCGVYVNVGSWQNYILEPVSKYIKKVRGLEVLCLDCTQKQNTREV